MNYILFKMVYVAITHRMPRANIVDSQANIWTLATVTSIEINQLCNRKLVKDVLAYLFG